MTNLSAILSSIIRLQSEAVVTPFLILLYESMSKMYWQASSVMLGK